MEKLTAIIIVTCVRTKSETKSCARRLCRWQRQDKMGNLTQPAAA